MSKHTPGPWLLQDGFLTIYALSHGVSGSTRAIAKMVWSAPYVEHASACVTKEEAEANGRLIAAAPDLLAACQSSMRGEPGWQKLIHAAVAKAEGA